MESLQTLWNSIDWGMLGTWSPAFWRCFVPDRPRDVPRPAALALGDPTAKRQHRLSFNPLRHIDWMGFVSMLIVASAGQSRCRWTCATSKSPSRHGPHRPGGPGVQFPDGRPRSAAHPLDILERPGDGADTVLFDFLLNVVILNIGLGLFNLLPIPPLDGSKVLFALLPDRAYLYLMRYERYGMLVLLLLVAFDVGSDFLSRGILLIFSALANLIVL